MVELVVREAQVLTPDIARRCRRNTTSGWKTANDLSQTGRIVASYGYLAAGY
jgi:hypothetical protein